MRDTAPDVRVSRWRDLGSAVTVLFKIVGAAVMIIVGAGTLFIAYFGIETTTSAVAARKIIIDRVDQCQTKESALEARIALQKAIDDVRSENRERVAELKERVNSLDRKVWAASRARKNDDE